MILLTLPDSLIEIIVVCKMAQPSSIRTVRSAHKWFLIETHLLTFTSANAIAGLSLDLRLSLLWCHPYLNYCQSYRGSPSCVKYVFVCSAAAIVGVPMIVLEVGVIGWLFVRGACWGGLLCLRWTGGRGDWVEVFEASQPLALIYTLTTNIRQLPHPNPHCPIHLQCLEKSPILSQSHQISCQHI